MELGKSLQSLEIWAYIVWLGITPITNGKHSCFCSENFAPQRSFHEMVEISLLYHSGNVSVIKYVSQSGRKVVCLLWHWQSGTHPAGGTAIRLPALAGQQSGEENCGLDRSHTGWHLGRRVKRNPCQHPLCSQVTQLPPPLSIHRFCNRRSKWA